jgi:hypothetical protein
LACFCEVSSIALAHLSQYFSIIIAPSVSYLTSFVAGSPHPAQNLELFFALGVNGSILFNVFRNNYIFSNYGDNVYNKLDKTIIFFSSIYGVRAQEYGGNGSFQRWVVSFKNSD